MGQHSMKARAFFTLILFIYSKFLSAFVLSSENCFFGSTSSCLLSSESTVLKYSKLRKAQKRVSSLSKNVVVFDFNKKTLRKQTRIAASSSVDTDPLGNENYVTVRFVNTISGKDVVTKVPEGFNLLVAGDEAGVKLPRACRTGLCGSCTCEVKDPAAIVTPTNPREGFATIRACSAKCFVPEGEKEMIIDVYRMRRSAGKPVNSLEGVELPADEAASDPMARFSGNWEKEFRPQWELEKSSIAQGQVGVAFDPKKRHCSGCAGTGRITCYCCDGVGYLPMNKNSQCAICVGLQTVGCGSCRGTGSTMSKKPRA